MYVMVCFHQNTDGGIELVVDDNGMAKVQTTTQFCKEFLHAHQVDDVLMDSFELSVLNMKFKHGSDTASPSFVVLEPEFTETVKVGVPPKSVAAKAKPGIGVELPFGLTPGLKGKAKPASGVAPKDKCLTGKAKLGTKLKAYHSDSGSSSSSDSSSSSSTSSSASGSSSTSDKASIGSADSLDIPDAVDPDFKDITSVDVIKKTAIANLKNSIDADEFPIFPEPGPMPAPEPIPAPVPVPPPPPAFMGIGVHAAKVGVGMVDRCKRVCNCYFCPSKILKGEIRFLYSPAVNATSRWMHPLCISSVPARAHEVSRASLAGEHARYQALGTDPDIVTEIALALPFVS
jgi:hypothetical protein